MRSVRLVTVAPEGYVHIVALDEATDALAGGLHDAGCAVVRTRSAWAPPPTLNLVIGWHLLADAAPLIGLRAVAWQLEALGEGGGWWDTHRENVLRSFERVWDFDAENTKLLHEIGIAADLVPVGHHARLERVTRTTQEVDVLMYGSPSPRRTDAARACRSLGLNVVELPSGTYGEARNAWIGRSKCVLGVQYYPGLGRFDQVRAAFLVANHTHYIAERARSVAPTTPFVESVAYEDLAEHAAAWCRLPSGERAARTAAAAAVFARDCSMTSYVASALAALG